MNDVSADTRPFAEADVPLDRILGDSAGKGPCGAGIDVDTLAVLPDFALPADMVGLKRLAAVIECLLFVAGEPLTTRDLIRTTESDENSVHAAIRILRDRYAESGLQVVEIAHGFQLATRSEFGAAVAKLVAPNANKLSKPALETVTIVAYRQPCTQAEIEAVRGVASDGVLKTLLERELIRDAGRKPTPGRPILYATTDAFLHYFGLAELTDLPLLDEDELTDFAVKAADEAARVQADEAAARVALTAAGVDE